MDRVLYKYRTDSVYTEQLITAGETFLATAHQLNDPFECSLLDISKEWLDSKSRIDMQGAIAGFVMSAKQAKHDGGDFFGLDPTAADDALADILSGGNLEASYEAMREFIRQRTGYHPSDCRVVLRRIDQQLTETGIFSMSANPAQPLMWAHYADSHKGLALGFREVAGSKLADPNHCRAVIYSDELPAIDSEGLKTTLSFSADEEGRIYSSGLKVAFDDETFQRVVTTKPTCWSYEEEFRYIEPFGGVAPWPGEIAECTFGWKCPDVRRQHYIALLKGHVLNDVLLFEMQPKPGSNALIRVPMNPPVVRGRKRAKPKGRKRVQMLAPSAYGAKMEQLLRKGRFGDVIAHSNDNLKKNPDSPHLLYWKASAYGHSHNHSGALEIFRGLTQAHPEWPDPWFGAGVALGQLGRFDEARSCYEQAYKLEPTDPSHALNLGSYLIADPDRWDEGMVCLRQAERLGHRRARRLIAEAEEARKVTGKGQ